MSPGDGVVSGIGTVNAASFGAEKARCMVVAYDASVLAGTQGAMNHKKQDRLFELAQQVALAGGAVRGGRRRAPRGHRFPAAAHARRADVRDVRGLSGLVPLVGVVSGRCFAGNAALLGCCDVIIATENSNIGMGGPVMIEGAGLGACAPEDIGPIGVQSKNGVVDVRVADEAAGGRGGQAVPGVLSGIARDLVLRRPAPAAPRDSREPIARLRHARGDRDPGRHRFGARAPARVRRRDDHRARAHRGQAVRRDRQRAAPPVGRDRCGCGRQGRAISAAVRRVRAPGDFAARHARVSWSGPRPKKPRSCATSAGCSSWLRA